MANRITEEQKIQINELYYENHNKSLTARLVGVSVASVNRYLIPDYIPKAQRVKIICDTAPQGADDFISALFSDSLNYNNTFKELTKLTKEEQEEINSLKGNIF